MRRLAWLAAAALGVCAAAWGAEIQDTVLSAYKAFLEGRLDDASAQYRYLETLGVPQPNPDTNLALLARDSGDQDAALAQWVKSSLEPDADGFVWNQRGWAYLSAGRSREARESFTKAIDRSSTTAEQAEANLGLGWAQLEDGNPKLGLDPLRKTLLDGPYLLSAGSLVMARIELASRDKQAALAYLRESLDLDPLNFEAVRDAANLYQKIGENREAWRAYHRLLALDPQDEQAQKKIKKLAQFITGDPEESMPVRRLARPLLDPDAPPDVPPTTASATIRVGLFSGPDERPEAATSVYFVSNVDFKVIAQSGEIVTEDGKAGDQWQVSFRPETDLVELRDASMNLRFTTKLRFRVVPQRQPGSVLLKSAVFPSTEGFDPGDRELRGVIEVQPTPKGFMLVNELKLEDYLKGAVSSALPDRTPLEAYKAEAVVARTMAVWAKARGPQALDGADICDSPRCLRYVGVTEELHQPSLAVAQTEGLVLALGDRVARVAQHVDSGGVTESGAATGDPRYIHLLSVADGPSSAFVPRTPEELERWVHEAPPRDSYGEASGLAQTHARWLRILEAADLTERANRSYPIGALTALRVARRSSTGRVQQLEVRGAHGSFTLAGADDIGDFLSPGSLRSTLFTITPIMRGRKAERFLLWGAGTGSGLGMSETGAIGQAALGRTYPQILAVYFPGLAIRNYYHPPRPPRRGRYRRTLNPRLAKKHP